MRRRLIAAALVALAVPVLLVFFWRSSDDDEPEPEVRPPHRLHQSQKPAPQLQAEPVRQAASQPAEALKLEAQPAVEVRPAPPATRASDSRFKTDQIRVRYTVPSSTIHKRIHERLKEERALEMLQEFLSPFRLPRKLTVKLEECDGDPNASYEDATVSICYDYIDELWRRMPTESSKTDVAPIDAIIGPLLDTALHEFAHALFDMHKVPVLGREEDAADQVAAFMTLNLSKAEARRLILGTNYAYRNEIAAERRSATKQAANVHSTPAQRRYNLLCIAYGSDPTLYSDFVGRDFLPRWRAEDCEDEYKQLEYAYKALIGPFIDRDLERKVMSRSWLPDASTSVQRRSSPLFRQGQAR